MINTQLTPAPAGLVVTFPGAEEEGACTVVALLLDIDPTTPIGRGAYQSDQPRVRAVALRSGRLEVAPPNATVASA